MPSELRLDGYHGGSDIDVDATASNGVFAGLTRLFVQHEAVLDAVSALQGFPSNPSDERTATIGSFGPDVANGGVGMRLFCVDRAGHMAVEVTLDSNAWLDGISQMVRLVRPVEAATFDTFLADLRAIADSGAGTATLPQA